MRVWQTAVKAILFGALFFAVPGTFVGDSPRPTDGLSWELAGSPPGPNVQWRVFDWLRRNRRAIADAERTRNVSRIAIAGVIAYEAIENVLPMIWRPFARYSGPGKVHYRESHIPLVEGEPLAKEIEVLGYLPARTMVARARVLSTDDGAIDYIAAILAAFSDAANLRHREIRCRADLLATFYSSWTLREARQHLVVSRRALEPNDVGQWVLLEHRFLEAAVGQSRLTRICSRTRKLGSRFAARTETTSDHMRRSPKGGVRTSS